MKTLRIILGVIFVLLIIVDIYGIRQYHISFARQSIYFLCLLMVLLSYRAKGCWFVLLSCCLYGIYNLYAINFYAAEPTFAHITSTLEYILTMHDANKLLRGIVNGSPFYLYGFLAILLLTKAGRRSYGIIITSKTQ